MKHFAQKIIGIILFIITIAICVFSKEGAMAIFLVPISIHLIFAKHDVFYHDDY